MSGDPSTLRGDTEMQSPSLETYDEIVIPKEIQEKLHLSPQQRLQVVEKGVLKGMSKTDLREKKDRL